MPRRRGYRRAGPFSPGAGAHFVKMDGTGTENANGAIDFEHPLAYLYDGTSETSEVVGVMYYSLAKDAPQGFAGPNDVWHQHSGACLVHNADGTVDSPASRSIRTPHRRCATTSVASS